MRKDQRNNLQRKHCNLEEIELKTLGLISCTKAKQTYLCKAREMYSASDLFRKAYKYCTANYTRVAILSAKYGLLLPNDIIDPYNLTLNEMSTEEVKAWSEKVFRQMTSKLDLEYRVLFC